MSVKLSSEGLPEYHDHLLIVQVRDTTPVGPLARGSAMVNNLGSSGLQSLLPFERAGLVKQVIPILPSSRLPQGLGIMARGQGEGTQASGILEGVSIVELEEGADATAIHSALANDEGVESVSRVPIRYWLARRVVNPPPATIAAVPPPAGSMWNLAKIGWYQAMENGLDTAQQVHVAVLDTGIDLAHPDFPAGEITYVYDDPNNSTGTTDQDIVGHGTHVSGTIRAMINNNVGINGITSCRLSVYKIFKDQLSYIDQAGNESFAYVVDPILYRSALAACVDADVQVINLSIGGYGAPDTVEKNLFQALIDGGTTIVAAMGNDNTSQNCYPAAIPGVVAVGATKANDYRASFSNYGSHMALCAPGVGIWSTLPTYGGQTGFRVGRAGGRPVPTNPQARDTDYDAWDGTSMAAPHVAAAAALIIAKHGKLSPAEVKSRLMQAVDKVPGMQGQEVSNLYGAGRLNLLKI